MTAPNGHERAPLWEDLMVSNATYVSEQWLRAYVYERGKDGDADASPGSHRRLRLAEARATLYDLPRQWPTDSADPDDTGR